MKAWTVLAIAHDGEMVCWDCMTPEEILVAKDEKLSDEISPLFASDVEGPETCGRCLQIIDGTEDTEMDEKERVANELIHLLTNGKRNSPR